MSGFGAAPVAAGTAPMVAGGSGSAVAAGDANHTVPSAAPVPLPRKHTGPPPPYIKVPVEDGGESVPAIPLVRALKRARVADGVVYTTDDVGAVPAGNPARHVVTKLRRHDAFLRYVHPPIVVSDACVGRWCVGSCVGHVTGALFRCRYQRNAELLAAVLDPTTTTGTTARATFPLRRRTLGSRGSAQAGSWARNKVAADVISRCSRAASIWKSQVPE